MSRKDSIKFQVNSKHFDPTSIKFLDEIVLDEGIFVFFFCLKNIFSLGAALFSKKEPHRILWIKEEPVWRTSEDIQPIRVEKKENKLSFQFSFHGNEYSFPLSLADALRKKKDTHESVFEKIRHKYILEPIPLNEWESEAVFNTAALFLDDRVHFIYRAIGKSGISVFGYASSKDGIHIEERFPLPIYVLETPFKSTEYTTLKTGYMSGGSWCGCEDPRIVQIDDSIYMTYTAFDGSNPPCVALTSIGVDDFLNKRWTWKKPKCISPARQIHKNWVIFPEKINNQYAILHSITPAVLINYFDSLEFDDNECIQSHFSSHGQSQELRWDNCVRGVGPPPIKIRDGWLVLYHAMDKRDPGRYKIGGLILDEKDPTKVLYRSSCPFIEPNEQYENRGYKEGVVYSCGAVYVDSILFVYYGASDSVVCAAKAHVEDIVKHIMKVPKQPN